MHFYRSYKVAICAGFGHYSPCDTVVHGDLTVIGIPVQNFDVRRRQRPYLSIHLHSCLTHAIVIARS
jgi:hypothetical protein